MHKQTCCPTRLLMHTELELGDEERFSQKMEIDDSLLRQKKIDHRMAP